MKKNNKTLITLLLAGMLCSTVAGVANFSANAVASADEVKYALESVFTAQGSTTISSETLTDNEQDKATAKFSFTGKDAAVRYTNYLAFTWYEGKGEAKYLNFTFSFADTDFSHYSFAVESQSAWATEDEKVTNTVYFVNKEGVISVAVLNDGEEFVLNATKDQAATETIALETAVVAKTNVTLSFGEALDEEGNKIDGAFSVLVNGQNVGTFENVGANWSEYKYEDTYAERMFPLVISGTASEGKETTSLYFKQLNGQSFDNVADGKVVDDAAPVLVVNEELNGFELGDCFSLDYQQIDVLQKTLPTETKVYYQYNPTDAKPDYEGNTISGAGSSLYFMDTVYEENGEETTVYRKYGAEYVSVIFKLGDSAHTGDNKAEYDLSWYAADSAIQAWKQTAEDGTETTTDFIKIYVSEEGADYTILKRNATDPAKPYNEKTDNYDERVKAYQALLDEEAKSKYLDEDVNFPSLAWLFSDDNGYRNLKFTISYKTPSSDSPKSPSAPLSYNTLKLKASEEGLYEFKIFANDLAGNPMQYYKDGELVDVTTSNVWDIEEIPSFTFRIKNQGVKVKESSSYKVSKSLNDKYTLSDLTVLGATNKGSEFKLYKLADVSNYSKYTSVTFSSLKENADKLIKTAAEEGKEIDYFDIYLTAYASLAGFEKSNFKELQPENKLIEETDKEWDNTDNKFHFDASAGSFVAAEEGGYLLIANYWNKEITNQRAGAYKIVSVGSESDSVSGESNWLKNNLVSVILFSIAGVLLVIIIILLLVKPSNETLEDVDKKVKKEKKSKKEKKEDK